MWTSWYELSMPVYLFVSGYGRYKTDIEKCNVMNDAWVEGAASAKFNGIPQTEFLADIDAAGADDAAIADLEAELKMKRDVRW